MFGYEPFVYEASNKLQLPYRLFQTCNRTGEKLPLLVFLHGAGERGTDNAKQLKHGAKEFSAEAFQREFQCVVLAPQCAKNTCGSMLIGR